MSPEPEPAIGLGLCVWRDRPDGEAYPAIVTKPGAIISVIIFPPETRAGIVKDSVRHIKDPRRAEFAHLNKGCWDYTEEYKAITSLAKLIAGTPKK